LFATTSLAAAAKMVANLRATLPSEYPYTVGYRLSSSLQLDSGLRPNRPGFLSFFIAATVSGAGRVLQKPFSNISRYDLSTFNTSAKCQVIFELQEPISLCKTCELKIG
jgi:hypothetical protein